MSEQRAEESNAPGSDVSETSGADVEGSDDPQVISDDQLPEDLRPTDDNPLAKPADDDGDEGGLNLEEQAGEAAGGPPG